MKPIVLMISLFLSLPAFARHSCWQNNADGARSTAAVVQMCGVNDNWEANYCYDYCTGIRRGSVATCNHLCGTDFGGDSGNSGGSGSSDGSTNNNRPTSGPGSGQQGSQCRMSSDCPTFSSCDNGWCIAIGGGGSQCRMSSDCPTFSSCENGWCIGMGGGGSECRISSDCPTFYTCNNGWCVR